MRFRSYPSSLLFEYLDTILPTLTAVINKFFNFCIFPPVYEAAIVKPLLKKSSLEHNNLKNFRPVSNLSLVSKIIEKVILSQLFSHLCTNQLFNPFQSAYRPGHSTETALSKVMNDLLCSLDHENVFVLTLLDLSAAFDLIDHTILLHCLEHVFGIHDTALHWFSSYLTNRTQTVTVNNCSSAPVPISCGVQ